MSPPSCVELSEFSLHFFPYLFISFMKKLQEFLENDYEDFESLENVEKSSYVLGSELWESKFDGLLALVKEYIVLSLHLGRGVVSLV